MKKLDPEDMKKLRKACKLTSRLRAKLATMAVIGKSPQELDDFVKLWCDNHDCKSAVKGYSGYPAHVCISVNDVACHGIPNSRPFKNGDVVSIDVALKHDGWHGDCCTTVIVGSDNPTTSKLLHVARGATKAGISIIKPGVFTGSIGHEIEAYVKYHDHQVLRNFAGHGIGRKLHLPPSVPNFGRLNSGEPLEAGMVITVEPIVVTGSSGIQILEDGWTVRTNDFGFAAQFEETVLVTEDGHEVLT